MFLGVGLLLVVLTGCSGEKKVGMSLDGAGRMEIVGLCDDAGITSVSVRDADAASANTDVLSIRWMGDPEAAPRSLVLDGEYQGYSVERSSASGPQLDEEAVEHLLVSGSYAWSGLYIPETQARRSDLATDLVTVPPVFEGEQQRQFRRADLESERGRCSFDLGSALRVFAVVVGLLTLMVGAVVVVIVRRRSSPGTAGTQPSL